MAELENTLGRLHDDHLRLEQECAQLRAECDKLQRGYTAIGVESWPCPGCEFERGNWIKKCGLHQQIDDLDDRRDAAEKRGIELHGYLRDAVSALESMPETAEGWHKYARWAEGLRKQTIERIRAAMQAK